MFSALVGRAELDAAHGYFVKRAKDWRGQYYSVANRPGDEYERMFSSEQR